MIPGTENRGTENHARPPRGEDDVPEGNAVHARSACGITEMACALDGVGGDFRRLADETRERRGPQLPRARVPPQAPKQLFRLRLPHTRITIQRGTNRSECKIR